MSKLNEWGKIVAGTILLLMLNAIAITIGLTIGSIIYESSIGQTPVGRLLNMLLTAAILGISISQLLYAIPICLWLKYQEKIALLKGAIVGAVITALLNGGCWLIAFDIF
ncbi:MAG: hypothetical protein AB4352_19925 [Hormoscilla sp.]